MAMERGARLAQMEARLQKAGLAGAVYERGGEVFVVPDTRVAAVAIHVMPKDTLTSAAAGGELVRLPDDAWLVRVFCLEKRAVRCVQADLAIGFEAVAQLVRAAMAAKWFRGWAPDAKESV